MPLARLLVVEDDVPIAKLLRQFLDGEGFETTTASCGEVAIAQARAIPPDLIVLDLMLPGLDGVETCQALREFYAGPILMLTAHEDEMQEIIALNTGVDDFMHKPIRPHVLKARILALLRRHAPKRSALSIGDFRIERDSRRVYYRGEDIGLSESEFELFWALASQAGEVITRDTLFQRLRGKDYDGLDRSIDMRLSKLRKKLATYTDHEVIRTLRQIGYIFVKD